MILSLVSELSDSGPIVYQGPWFQSGGFSSGTYWPRWSNETSVDAYGTNTNPEQPDSSEVFSALHERCHVTRMQLGLAESCTGGMIASRITDFPGSSRYFYGGWVTYSNHSKFQWLQVSPHDLESDGPVSQPVVRDMLCGIFENSPCSHGIAVSGIAGPDGGTARTPTGTVWIGVAHKSARAMLRCFQFAGDRNAVRTAATAAAGLMMLELLWLLDNRIDRLTEL